MYYRDTSPISVLTLGQAVQGFEADVSFREMIRICEALTLENKERICEALTLKTKELPVINQLNANSENSSANDVKSHVASTKTRASQEAIQGDLFLDPVDYRSTNNHGRYRNGL